MGIDEAITYVEGQQLRQRDMYQCTRMLSNVVYHVLTGKDLEWQFPWDEEAPDALTDAEMAEAMERARAAEQYMAALKKKQNETEGQ